MDCKDLVSVEQEGLEVIPAIKLLQALKKAYYSKSFSLSTQQKRDGWRSGRRFICTKSDTIKMYSDCLILKISVKDKPLQKVSHSSCVWKH